MSFPETRLTLVERLASGGSERGARLACASFSRTAGCRRHGIDAFRYVRDFCTRPPLPLAET